MLAFQSGNFESSVSENKLPRINVLRFAQLTQIPKYGDLRFFWDVLYKVFNTDLTCIIVPRTCLD